MRLSILLNQNPPDNKKEQVKSLLGYITKQYMNHCLTKRKSSIHLCYEYSIWCERRDLNPYVLLHTPLKRARLPIPPLSLILFVPHGTSEIIANSRTYVKTFLKIIYFYFFSRFNQFVCVVFYFSVHHPVKKQTHGFADFSAAHS